MPSTVGITISFFGVNILVKTVNSFFITRYDIKRIHEGALEAFFKIEEKLFESEGGTQKWTPLTIKYKAWKNKHYPSLPIMQMTGALKNALTGKDKDSLQITGTEDGSGISLVLLSNYWHNHQEGITVPQRKTIDFSDNDVDFIVDSMLKATIGGRLSRLFTRG